MTGKGVGPPGHGLLFVALAPTLLLGCVEEPALQVGPVGFAPGDLAGLHEEQVDRLILITAVGAGVARQEEERLGAPVLDRRRAEEVIRLLRQETVLEAAGAGEEVLRARYRTSPRPELEVRHLLIRSDRWDPEEEREEARRRAEEALARARSGEAFPDLVAEFSEEPGAAGRGGLLEPGREGSWVQEFWEAALALQEEEVSEVVETEYGFHLLRLEERRFVPFEEVRHEVAEAVAALVDDGEAWAEKVAQWTDGLRVLPDAVADFRPGDPDPDRVLATWPTGELRAPDAARHLVSLPASRARTFLEGSPEVREEEVSRIARDRILLREAEERGVVVPATVPERLVREWTHTVHRWAAALGSRQGQDPEEVREAALTALGATDQEARIARAALEEWEPALRDAYPVIRAEP